MIYNYDFRKIMIYNYIVRYINKLIKYSFVINVTMTSFSINDCWINNIINIQKKIRYLFDKGIFF